MSPILVASGRKLAFKKGSLELDGKEPGKFPEDSRKIEVDVTAGKLTVSVDCKELASTEL